MGGLIESASRPVAWLRNHPLAADTLLAGVLTVVALVVHASSPQLDSTDPERDQTWWTVLLVIAAVAPIMFRRIRPVAVVAVVAAAQIACELLDVVGPGWIGLLVATYSLGAYTDGRRRVRAAVAVGVPIAALLVGGMVDGDVTPIDAVAAALALTAGLALGDNLRRRRLHVESLAERADRAEREREILARERVTEERTRIARELHDIVAHSVSVMVIQAAAARRTLSTQPAAAGELLANIERTGRQTMDELRQVLGVLRSDATERLAVPLPTLADLPALVDATGGLPIRLAVTGLVDDVPAGVGVSVYRVVQEALTNANRHAGPGATADVGVRCSATGVEVRVDDDGRGASTTRSTDGYGLIGMNERVASAGGTFAAGPRAGGGWRVTATFPLQPATAPAAVVEGAELVS